ncbi:MAG TPA: aminotransferase class III-fold pyridoxal phosphate-dependent enzyme [Longimicrobiales bacterium]|nr:aminotransferase class III-fold pyridoxal phosphate-dependent enzyme [Longimicrobiales bacterium]
MTELLSGDELPHLVTDIPGPASAALAARLARVESRNITALDPAPICWTDARGAAVRDADGNVYVDLTAGFGVAHAGHANDAVAAAIAGQARRLAHGLGDVYPPEPRVRLLEKLAALAPGDLGVTILGSAGAEAVEAALKTALLRTRRAGVIAFEGAYHGLTYGALGVTHRTDFRKPFRRQLYAGVHFAPFPDEHNVADVLAHIDGILEFRTTGAIIIEPIQGRGGLRVPPAGFLRALRDRCDGSTTLLIFDEIYTGCGRTGRWFACEHEDVVPDVIILGKALTGSIALSAAIGTADVMSGWPPSAGEALHTSTFLGNPVACAAALAQLDEIERHGLLARATAVGDTIRARAASWHRNSRSAGAPRGIGLLQGVPLEPPGAALRVVRHCLAQGVLVLAEGADADVLAITPPATITDAQLGAALDAVEAAIATLDG